MWWSSWPRWNVIQAFGNATPGTMSDTMKSLDINATFTAAVRKELVGGKHDVYHHETKVTQIPFDKSIKQGEWKSLMMLNMVMKSIFVSLQEKFGDKGSGRLENVAEQYLGRGGHTSHLCGQLLHGGSKEERTSADDG